jgi:hypothetical protein
MRLLCFAPPLAVLVLAGCGARPSVVPPSVSPARETTPLAALLAVALCPQTVGRTFSAAVAGGDVIDTYLRVQRCDARAVRDEVRVSADGVAWMAVDRDFGDIGFETFVHAAVHADVRARVSARAAGESIAISVAPMGDVSISVVPVGPFEPNAHDWAALAAIELAPSIGVSPEALAKRQLQIESERALRAALARSVTVDYDARRGVVLPGAPESAAGVSHLRVLPGGSAEIGAFRPGGESTKVRVLAPRLVAARGICRSHAEHLRDADRRGEVVTVDGWSSVRGDAIVEVPAMPCPWTFALRAIDGQGAVVGVAFSPAKEDDERPMPGPSDRWVAFDDVSLDPPGEDPSLQVTVTSDAWHFTVGSHDAPLPSIAVLAPDEQFVVHLTRRQGSQTIMEDEEPLAFEGPGDFARTVALATRDGAMRTMVRIRSRVRVPEVSSIP